MIIFTEGHMEIPKSWLTTKIGQITEYVQRGKSPKYIEKSDLPVINQKCIRWDIIKTEYLKFVHPEQWSKWNEERFLKEGDVLWNSTGTGTIGRASIFKKMKDYDRVVVDSHVTVVRVNQCYIPKLLHYWIMSPVIQNKINEMHTGSTNQVELSKSEVVETLIPLPPLNEQKRIVAKIEQLQSHSRKAQEALKAVPELLEKFRQSVLASAFRGDLTTDWRAQNFSDISPKSWNIKSLDEVIDSFQNGISKRKSDAGKNTTVLRLADVQSGAISFQNNREIKLSEKEIKKYSLSHQDILIIRVNGSIDIVGNFILFDSEKTCTYCDHFIKIQVKRNLILPKFLLYFSKSLSFRNYVKQNIVSSAGQNTINQFAVKNAFINLPQLEEQKEIVRRVDALFAKADRMEKYYLEAKNNMDKLNQSILAKAFRGELVPQDPNDEPAPVLLQRIREQKESGVENKPKKKKKVEEAQGELF